MGSDDDLVSGGSGWPIAVLACIQFGEGKVTQSYNARMAKHRLAREAKNAAYWDRRVHEMFGPPQVEHISEMVQALASVGLDELDRIAAQGRDLTAEEFAGFMVMGRVALKALKRSIGE
jgi:hypothetical protein